MYIQYIYTYILTYIYIYVAHRPAVFKHSIFRVYLLQIRTGLIKVSEIKPCGLSCQPDDWQHLLLQATTHTQTQTVNTHTNTQTVNTWFSPWNEWEHKIFLQALNYQIFPFISRSLYLPPPLRPPPSLSLSLLPLAHDSPPLFLTSTGGRTAGHWRENSSV